MVKDEHLSKVFTLHLHPCVTPIRHYIITFSSELSLINITKILDYRAKISPQCNVS